MKYKQKVEGNTCPDYVYSGLPSVSCGPHMEIEGTCFGVKSIVQVTSKEQQLAM